MEESEALGNSGVPKESVFLRLKPPEVPVNGVGSTVGGKISYAGVVGTSVLPEIDSLPSPIQAGKFRRIVIPQQEYELQRNQFRFSLIGRANFRITTMDELREIARGAWKLSNAVILHSLGKGFIIFQFHSEADMTEVWRRGFWNVGKQYIRFQRWSPDFNIHSPQPAGKLVWVRFPDLPLEYWHEKVLLSIAKSVGRPVSLDRRTRQGSVGHYARVLIELEGDVVRPNEVQIERLEPGTVRVFSFLQKVIFEDGIQRCSLCNREGHLGLHCKFSSKVDELQVQPSSVPAVIPNVDGIPDTGVEDSADSSKEDSVDSTSNLNSKLKSNRVVESGKSSSPDPSFSLGTDPFQIQKILNKELNSKLATSPSSSVDCFVGTSGAQQFFNGNNDQLVEHQVGPCGAQQNSVGDNDQFAKQFPELNSNLVTTPSSSVDCSAASGAQQNLNGDLDQLVAHQVGQCGAQQNSVGDNDLLAKKNSELNLKLVTTPSSNVDCFAGTSGTQRYLNGDNDQLVEHHVGPCGAQQNSGKLSSLGLSLSLGTGSFHIQNNLNKELTSKLVPTPLSRVDSQQKLIVNNDPLVEHQVGLCGAQKNLGGLEGSSLVVHSSMDEQQFLEVVLPLSSLPDQVEGGFLPRKPGRPRKNKKVRAN